MSNKQNLLGGQASRTSSQRNLDFFLQAAGKRTPQANSVQGDAAAGVLDSRLAGHTSCSGLLDSVTPRNYNPAVGETQAR